MPTLLFNNRDMKYGLIGDSVQHSYAKEFHESISPITYEIKSMDAKAFEELMTSKDFKGVNITIPYKEKVIKYLDEISDTAKEIGAVNIVINRKGKLYGDNVDAYGLEINIRHAHITIKNKHVLILGTGGTSNTAAYVCKRLGAKTITKATINENELSDSVVSYAKASKIKKTQVIINTTPVGMWPHVDDDTLVNLDNYPILESVLDCIYNPYKTKLMIEAKRRNLKYANGLMMLVAQGVKTNEMFTGKKYDKRIYLQTYLNLICHDTNIVLIGMPGAGKKKIGQALSDKLGIYAFDVDRQIEIRQNSKIFDLLMHYDARHYRDIESNMIRDLAKNKGKIISTGSGIVLRERNILALERNAVIIYVKRDIESIKEELANDRLYNIQLAIERYGSLENMLKQRDKLYRKYCDYVVVNKDDEDIVSDKVIMKIIGDDIKD